MQENQFIIFKLNNRNFGIDITQVDHIIEPSEIYKLPDTPEFIDGLINFRNTVYTLINLREKFNFPKKDIDESTKILIIDNKQMKFGFMVDEADEILSFEQNKIKSITRDTDDNLEQYIKGNVTKDKKTISVIDIDKIFSHIKDSVPTKN